MRRLNRAREAVAASATVGRAKNRTVLSLVRTMSKARAREPGGGKRLILTNSKKSCGVSRRLITKACTKILANLWCKKKAACQCSPIQSGK